MALLRRAPWQEHAACRGLDPDLFYPEKGGNGTGETARAVCAECPVAEPCLELGLSFGSGSLFNLGIWGGTTPAQRSRIIRERRGAVA